MSAPKVYLFGAPRIEQDSTSVEIQRRRTLGLFIYLLVSRQVHSRDKLAALFWPDTDQAGARANLRRDISRLKQAFGDESLLVEGGNVGWNPAFDIWLDVREFHAHLQAVASHVHPDGAPACPACAAALEQAVHLYTEPFLSGFSLPDSSEFDDWQFFQAEELRRQLCESLQALIAWYSSCAEFAQAIPHARRWLTLDNLHEPAHQALMRLYEWSGEHAAALRQYEECTRLLREKLKVGPDEETSRLYESIRLKQLLPPQKPETQPDSPLLPPSLGFPHSVHPFVGRDKEMSELVDLLQRPEVRLVTIVGLGGMGKTRLSLEAARSLLERYPAVAPDGGVFLSLACIDDPASLPYAIARELHVNMGAQGDPVATLAHALEHERMLLLMDNFEQLVEAAPVLEEMLNKCPGVKMLVTSREPLHLSFEWRIDLGGLSVPASDESAGDESEAIRLFLQSAEQVRPGFPLNSSTRPLVYRLCRRLAGMPLAIRLAASWLRAMTIEQILAEVERGLDILTSPLRDIPDRQRSMLAVFDSTWKMLSSEEQRAFAALSVFRGGFTAEAAEEVAQVSPYLLTGLVDRGLVRFLSDLRYEMHELTRQFAVTRLKENELASHMAYSRHSAYYLDLLKRASPLLYGPEPQPAIQALKNDLPNIRYGWDWAVQTLPLAGLKPFIQPLTDFCEIAGFLVIAEQAYLHAIQRHGDHASGREEEAALFTLWLHYLLFLVFEGRHADAIGHLERMDALARSLDDAVSIADSWHVRGMVYYYLDRKEEALGLFRKAVEIYRPLDEPRRLIYSLNFLGEGLTFIVKPQEGLRCHTEALEISWRIGERRMESLSLSHMGVAHYFMDEFDQAASCWKAAVEGFEAVGDLRDEGRTRNNLSFLYHRLGEYGRAVQQGQLALALLSQVGDRISEANASETLGDAYFALGRYDMARQCYEKAIQDNQELLRGVGAMASFYTSLAALELAMGHYDAAELQLQKAGSLNEERHPWDVAKSLMITGQLYQQTGRLAQAMDKVEQGLAILEQAGDPLQAAELLLRKVSLLLSLGDVDAAGRTLERANSVLERKSMLPLLFEARLLSARVTHARGDKKEAGRILRNLHDEPLTEPQHAALHYTMWQLSHREEPARMAHQHYERLARRTPDVQYHNRLQELEAALGLAQPA